MENMGKEEVDVIRALRGDSFEAKLDSIWKELQSHVDHVLDREMKSSAGITNRVGWGFKQLIERKQGIFRMHMMGKRVNHAARTVITPDPNINIDEIGLPEVFAKQLTYRVPVTPWNVEELREMVINGPDVHPGGYFHDVIKRARIFASRARKHKFSLRGLYRFSHDVLILLIKPRIKRS